MMLMCRPLSCSSTAALFLKNEPPGFEQRQPRAYPATSLSIVVFEWGSPLRRAAMTWTEREGRSSPLKRFPPVSPRCYLTFTI